MSDGGSAWYQRVKLKEKGKKRGVIYGYMDIYMLRNQYKYTNEAWRKHCLCSVLRVTQYIKQLFIGAGMVYVVTVHKTRQKYTNNEERSDLEALRLVLGVLHKTWALKWFRVVSDICKYNCLCYGSEKQRTIGMESPREEEIEVDLNYDLLSPPRQYPKADQHAGTVEQGWSRE